MENCVDHNLYVVRLYDMFDGWVDVSEPKSHAAAQAQWNHLTNNGSKMTCYADGDYYKVFPADTKMMFTPETMGR